MFIKVLFRKHFHDIHDIVGMSAWAAVKNIIIRTLHSPNIHKALYMYINTQYGTAKLIFRMQRTLL